MVVVVVVVVFCLHGGRCLKAEPPNLRTSEPSALCAEIALCHLPASQEASWGRAGCPGEWRSQSPVSPGRKFGNANRDNRVSARGAIGYYNHITAW